MRTILKNPRPPSGCVPLLRNADDRETLRAVLALRDEWVGVEVLLAGLLARTLVDVERIAHDLAESGEVTSDGRLDPRVRLVDTLSARARTLCRNLNIHPRGRLGERRDQLPRRRAVFDARAALAARDSDLLG